MCGGPQVMLPSCVKRQKDWGSDRLCALKWCVSPVHSQLAHPIHNLHTVGQSRHHSGLPSSAYALTSRPTAHLGIRGCGWHARCAALCVGRAAADPLVGCCAQVPFFLTPAPHKPGHHSFLLRRSMFKATAALLSSISSGVRARTSCLLLTRPPPDDASWLHRALMTRPPAKQLR